jgi:hypothetical protein
LFLHPEIVQSTNTVDLNGLNRSAVPQNPDLRSASTRKQDQKDDIMRNMLVAALVLGMALAVSATSSAATLDPATSFLDVKLGSVPQIHLSAQSTNVVLTGSAGAHAIAEAASVFQTEAFTVASAAFTGLPSLTALKLSLVGGAGNFGEAATYANPMNGGAVVSGFGGLEANTGTATLTAGGFQFAIDLGVLGNGTGGPTIVNNVLQNSLVVTGAPFNTGNVSISGLSSNIVAVPQYLNQTGVAFTLNLTTVQLVTAYELTAAGVVIENNVALISAGTNNLGATPNADGSIKMVSPFRISTGSLAGNVAGSMIKTFTFVPEPGTVLLLVTGAAGLAIVGRKRMRK